MNGVYTELIPIDNYKFIVDRLVKDIIPVDLTYKSTRGEKSKQYDLMKLFSIDKEFTSIINEIKEKTLLCLQKNNLHYIKTLSVVSCWTVYGEENGYHVVHRHNNFNIPHISTVTYLKTPTPKAPNAGNFFYFNNESVYEIAPVEGQLLILPVWLLHGTYPQSEGLRQTLSVDFSFE